MTRDSVLKCYKRIFENREGVEDDENSWTKSSEVQFSCSGRCLILRMTDMVNTNKEILGELLHDEFNMTIVYA